MTPSLEVSNIEALAQPANGSSDVSPRTLPLTYEDFPRHPTQSLRFLESKKFEEESLSPPPQAKVKLRILIVGGGLGGLGCAIALARRGHIITVLEQATTLGEVFTNHHPLENVQRLIKNNQKVGAGIQIPSNSSRILHTWGVGPFLDRYAVEPTGMSFRRWENGEVIGYTKLVPDFRDNFQAPYYAIHRAHFLNALRERASELGVDIKFGCRVEKYDLEGPGVYLANGEFFQADLVVACDGVKSVARKLVLGGHDFPPQHTGFAAYRATVETTKMKDDPELSWLVEKPCLNIWIGGDKHVMTYTIAAGDSFNMVLSHIDHSDPASWTSENIIQEMKENFTGWDPRLTKIIAMVDKTLKWPLMSSRPLKKWVAPSNKVLIIGDAAHAMVPYMSQGAAMAIEDGAALAVALSTIGSTKEIPAALEIFEKERIQRSAQMQGASLMNGKVWHFADGPEQRSRDEAMKPEVDGRQFNCSPNQWSDPVTQWWAYGYDAEKEMDRRCKEASLGLKTVM